MAAILFGAYTMQCWYSVRDKKRILDLEKALSTFMNCFESGRYIADLQSDPRWADWIKTYGFDLEEKIIGTQLVSYHWSRLLLGKRHQPHVEELAQGRGHPLFLRMRESQIQLEREMQEEEDQGNDWD